MRICISHHHACDCREEKFKQLYLSSNALMTRLGAEGGIDPASHEAGAVMEALAVLDDGSFDMARIFSNQGIQADREEAGLKLSKP